MTLPKPMCHFFAFVAVITVAWAGSACASDERSIRGLTNALTALSPNVTPAEAELVSRTTHTSSRRLAREYRVTGPPIFQNFLIYVGARQKGYCYHFARDIGADLKGLHLKTLSLHWGASHPGTYLENNCLVITARDQPFSQGVVIDGWRHGGRLFWSRIPRDQNNQWEEDLAETALLQNDLSSRPKMARRSGD